MYYYLYIKNNFVTKNLSLCRVANDCCTPVLVPLRKTSEEGAYTSVHVATSLELEGVSGQYFFHCQAIPTGNYYCIIVSFYVTGLYIGL